MGVIDRVSGPVTSAWSRRSAGGTRVLPLLTVVAALAGVCVVLAPTALALAPPEPRLPVVVLAALFTAAELCVRHLQVRRHATTLSLSELPLTIGLAFVAPLGLVLARLAGSLLAFALRRQAPLKVLFNCVLSCADTLLVLALLHLLLQDRPVLDPRGWAVLPVVLVVSSVLARAVVRFVVLLHEGGPRTALPLPEAAAVAVPAATCGVLGITASLVVVADPRAVVLLVAAALLALAAHRQYAVMAESYARTQQLYRFTELTSTAGTVDAVLGTALTWSLKLLRSERAEVLLLARGPAAQDVPRTGPHLRRSLTSDGRAPEGGLREDDPVVAEVLRTGRGVTLHRGTRDRASQRFLDSHGLRDALLVPLWADGGLAGVLLAGDRAGAVRPYDKDDRLLAESIATQTGLALGAARVVDRLQYDSKHDGLTGLANRSLLNEWLRDATREVQEKGRQAAVLLIDLDGFKAVNDTLGHAQGDELLASAARRLQDEAGAHGQVARLGGDEFAVLLLDEPEEAVTARAEAMSRSLERTIRVDDVQVRVGGSIGVAMSPRHGVEGSALLHRADEAMYAAKRAGGGVRRWQADVLAC